jgi:hypothetical protein
VNCLAYLWDGSSAYKYTEKLFTGRRLQQDSTRANAFQHMVWVALMIRSEYIDWQLALDYYTIHENGEFDLATNTQARRRSRMDMLNNTVGWVYMMENPVAGGFTNDHLCEIMLFRAMNATKIGESVDPYAEYDRLGFKAAGNKEAIFRKPQGSDGVTPQRTSKNCDD